MKLMTQYGTVSVTKNKEKKLVLIKDVFASELATIGQTLYLHMAIPSRRKNAVKAWDQLENLAYQTVDNPRALKKMINLQKPVTSKKDILLKNVFQKELEEIGRFLYMQSTNPNTRQSAENLLDKLENLSNKSIQDSKALKNVIDLFWGLQNTKVLSQPIDGEKVAKLIKKYYV